MKYTAKFRTTPPPQPELFSLEEEPGGGLQAPLSEVAGRQEKVVRHVLEDLGSVCPVVQIRDLPVPHMMDQLAELLNLEEDVLDAGRLVDRFLQVPELVIEVPKISLDVIPLRTLVPEPQLAEQLVEVPTIVSFSSLQRTIEQTVDIPVPQGGGGRVGVRSLQGFPGQSSTAYFGADFPAATAEQNVDIPVPRGDRTLHPASTSSVLPVTASQGVFRTFPQNKKSAKVTSHSGSELPPHPSSSTAAAQLEDSVEWVRLREKHAGKTYFWNRRTNSTVWRAPAGVEVVWYGEKNEKGGSGTGTGTRVSLCLTSLLFLLGEMLTASPGRYINTGRAAYLPVTTQRHVPAVFRVRHPSDSVHRQCVGHSSYATGNCAGCKAVIAGDPAPRAVSSFRWPMMLGIMAGMLWKDSCLISWLSPYSAHCLVRHWIHAVLYVAPGLERETQPDVRAHSSSCGVHRVVHSPFGWLDHRCHCYVVTSCSSSAVSLLPGCLRRDVVLWWVFSLLMVLTILFGTM